MNKLLAYLAAALLFLAAGSHDADAHQNSVETMTSSWYGQKFHGRTTASGEPFNMHKLTAAHKEYPFGTRLLLTNPETDSSIIVVVNDRGPFIAGRELDVSKEAAKRLGFLKTGVIELEVEVLD